jgi:hypothetical protein
MHTIRRVQERKEAWAELVVPFGLVLDAPAPSAMAPDRRLKNRSMEGKAR